MTEAELEAWWGRDTNPKEDPPEVQRWGATRGALCALILFAALILLGELAGWR